MHPAIRGSTTVVTITGSNQELIGPNEKRVALNFFACPTAAGNVGINSRPLASAADGAPISFAFPGYPIWTRDFGDLVKGPWFGWGTNAGDKIIVFEGTEV